MNKKDFYKFIEQGALEGACRYFEYWFVYQNVPDNSRVLEIGAGRSALPQALKTKGGHVYVTDIDKSAVKYQVSNGILAENTNNLNSFGDEMFDVVVAASSIEHFDDDLDMVEQVYRVLKPGGLFIVTIPVGNKYIENLFENNPKHPRMRVYSYDIYYKTFCLKFEEIKKEFFKDSNKKPKDFIPHETWNGAKNVEAADGWGDNIGLCVVLKKL